MVATTTRSTPDIEKVYLQFERVRLFFREPNMDVPMNIALLTKHCDGREQDSEPWHVVESILPVRPTLVHSTFIL